MRSEFNFLELHFSVGEFQSCIGSRVDKIYQPDGFLFQLHKSGFGKRFLRLSDKVLWLAKEKPLMPESVSGLCSLLRKYLEGKKLSGIEQLGSERIVRFVFETQKEKFFLYVELFSTGNLILADSSNKIVAAKEERAWKDREIRRGLQYVPPPAKANLFELKEIPQDEKSLASLGFGKLLAREIIARGNDFNAYQSLLNEKSSPRAYGDGELSCIKLVQYKEEGEMFPSFSELIDARLSTTVAQQKQEKIGQAFGAKKVKLLEVISLQSKNIVALEKDAIELQHKGEIIYSHYQELKDILEEFSKLKAKMSLQEIKEKYKGHEKIKDVNPKTHEITIEIE